LLLGSTTAESSQLLSGGSASPISFTVQDPPLEPERPPSARLWFSGNSRDHGQQDDSPALVTLES
jgi:hypothetical protein